MKCSSLNAASPVIFGTSRSTPWVAGCSGLKKKAHSLLTPCKAPGRIVSLHGQNASAEGLSMT